MIISRAPLETRGLRPFSRHFSRARATMLG